MGRPIEYDKEKVLNQVMKVFWKKGYEGTSISDLVKVTGLNTRSMYNIFGGKEGLFHEALDTYNKTYFSGIIRTMKETPGFEGIVKFFDHTGGFISMDGCLIVNTLKERNVIDSASFGRVENFFKRLEKQFKENLQQAKKEGGFKGSPEINAKILIVFLQGLSASCRLKSSRATSQKMVGTFLKNMMN